MQIFFKNFLFFFEKICFNNKLCLRGVISKETIFFSGVFMKVFFCKICLFFIFIFLLALPGYSQYEAWNKLLGVPFFNANYQWHRQEFEQTMRRSCRLFFRGSNELRTAVPRFAILDSTAYEIRANYDKAGNLTVIDIIFANKGDNVEDRRIRKVVRNTARLLEKKISALGGMPKRSDYGHKKMQNDAKKWNVDNKAEIVLEYASSEFVALHISFATQSGSSGKQNKQAAASETDILNNVSSTIFGDVYIKNIPMVNQGNKGYCVPATVERVLRYYGINNINMHQLADAGNTNRGGGTSSRAMFSGISSACRKSGLKMASTGEVRMKMVKKYIDRGVPIFWCMFSNPEYEELRARSKQLRQQAESPQAWAKKNKKIKISSGGNGHMCLIIGYNELTEEIAVSNSWGDHEISPSWVPLRVAVRVSQGSTVVLMPR